AVCSQRVGAESVQADVHRGFEPRVSDAERPAYRINGDSGRIGRQWRAAEGVFKQVRFSIPIRIAGKASKQWIVNLAQRQSRCLPTGETQLGRNSDTRDKWIRISCSCINPNLNRRN